MSGTPPPSVHSIKYDGFSIFQSLRLSNIGLSASDQYPGFYIDTTNNNELILDIPGILFSNEHSDDDNNALAVFPVCLFVNPQNYTAGFRPISDDPIFLSPIDIAYRTIAASSTKRPVKWRSNYPSFSESTINAHFTNNDFELCYFSGNSILSLLRIMEINDRSISFILDKIEINTLNRENDNTDTTQTIHSSLLKAQVISRYSGDPNSYSYPEFINGSPCPDDWADMFQIGFIGNQFIRDVRLESIQLLNKHFPLIGLEELSIGIEKFYQKFTTERLARINKRKLSKSSKKKASV